MEARHSEEPSKNVWACGSRRLGRDRAEQWGDEEWDQYVKFFSSLLSNLFQELVVNKKEKLLWVDGRHFSMVLQFCETLGREIDLAVLLVTGILD